MSGFVNENCWLIEWATKLWAFRIATNEHETVPFLEVYNFLSRFNQWLRKFNFKKSIQIHLRFGLKQVTVCYKFQWLRSSNQINYIMVIENRNKRMFNVLKLLSFLQFCRSLQRFGNFESKLFSRKTCKKQINWQWH